MAGVASRSTPHVEVRVAVREPIPSVRAVSSPVVGPSPARKRSDVARSTTPTAEEPDDTREGVGRGMVGGSDPEKNTLVGSSSLTRFYSDQVRPPSVERRRKMSDSLAISRRFDAS